MKLNSPFCLTARRAIQLGVVLLSLVLASYLPRLKVNPDVFSNLPKDDPVAVFFNRVGEEFGGNYTCIIGLEAPDIFTREIIGEMIAIQDSIRYLEGVGHITSLVNVLDIRSGPYGIEIGRLIDEYEPPETPEELQALKAYTLSDPLYRGRLVSADARMTILAVKLQEGYPKIALARQIRQKVESMNLQAKACFGGQPYVIAAFSRSIARDLLILGPLCLLLILGVLYLGFRNLQGVILPALTVLLGLLWTFGFMGLFRIEISIITSIIPILLIAVGSAYTIHVLNRIEATPISDPAERVAAAWRYIAVPVAFTALTTMFGFLSFVFGSYLFMIKIFGLFTSAGIFFCMLFSLFLVPGLWKDRPGPSGTDRPHRGSFLSRWLSATAGRVVAHPRSLILGWAVLIIIAVSGIFRIGRKVDFIEYFRKNDPNRLTEQVLNKKMGGTYAVYVSVKGDILDPGVMQTIHATQQQMEKDPNLIYSQSVADLMIRMNEVMGEEGVPDTREKMENLWFLIEGQDVLEQLISEDRQEAIIQGTFRSSDTEKARAFRDMMEGFFAKQKDRPVQFALSGYPSLIVKLDESLVKSQFRSLAIALVLIFLSVTFLQRSVVKGALSMVPILATLALLYGFMGWTGIPLDIATVMVGAISIGIGIDYTIHISNHYSSALRQGLSPGSAADHAIRISGRAILINMLAVCAGFLVLCFSSLVPLVRFGLLIALTMLTSAAASLSLLPALLIHTTRKPNNHQPIKPGKNETTP